MTSAFKTADRILVVDDDPRIRQMLSRYFEGEGYLVSCADGGDAMRRIMRDEKVDIVFLDLLLPQQPDDGLALAREIRASSDVPIIMLTGRDDVIDRIVGLEVGADDYIAKPFNLREVLARTHAILRRRHASPPQHEQLSSCSVVTFDAWRLDMPRRQLLAPLGEEVELTTGEFDMLCIFVKNAGRIFERETLMNMTRSRNLETFDRAIDAQIVRLRKKIEVDPSKPKIIKSVRGIGYVFAAKVGTADPLGPSDQAA